MADSALQFSTDASGLKRNFVLETPEKEDLQTYSQTPVSSVRRPKTSNKNKQGSSASAHVNDPSSYSAESRAKTYLKSDLDKIRVSLFPGMEQKNNKKAPIFPVNATSFYGYNESRFLPLAPNILGTVNKKIDKSKPVSPSLYDFPNKRITRKRKGGGINSGVGHGIKKLKSKANSIKHESPEIDEDTVTEKQCETSQKENVVVEDSESIEYYNPKKKFFKHRRPTHMKITLGKKLKPKKNVKQEEKIVNYYNVNVLDSFNSKKEFLQQVNIGPRTRSNSEAQSTFSHSPVTVKKEIFHQPVSLTVQHQQNPQKLLPAIRNSIGHHSSSSEKSSNLETETENEVEGTDQELPYQNLAMDIENNNFSNNEMMTDVAVHNDEELKNQLTDGNNLFFIESLAMDDCSEQNNLEKENSSDSGNLKCISSGSEQHQKNVGHSDVRNFQCQKFHYFYELGDKNEEMAHSNYYSDFCDIQFEGWTKDDSMEISIGTDSIIILKPFSPKSHREKAFDVLRFIKTEIGLSDHDLIDNQEKHFFMYIRERSIIGILVAEYLDCAFKLESNSSVPWRMFSATFPVKCGINIIWVSKNHRRQGIATKMMHCLRNRFCSNYRMDVSDVAFSIPTTSGRHFAEKYVGSCDFKVF